jgi:hypothetical protein
MESVLHCQLSSDFDSITVDGPELRQSCKSGGSRIVFARSKSLQSACTSAYRGKSRCCMRHPNSGDVPLVRVKENMVKIDESIKFRTSSEQVYRGALEWFCLPNTRHLDDRRFCQISCWLCLQCDVAVEVCSH